VPGTDLRIQRPQVGLCCLFLLVISVMAEAATHPCPGAKLAVDATDEENARLACAGGTSAIDFLGALGLKKPPLLVIELVDRLPALHDTGLLGSFDADQGRLRVLSYPRCQAIARRFPQFGMPMDTDMYRGIVAHEVGHAMMAFSFRGPRPSILAQEYIAYVTQFMAMSPGLRQHILEHTEISAFEDESQLSLTYYLLDPQAFGIAAFKHFMALPDPRVFVRRLLSDGSPACCADSESD